MMKMILWINLEIEFSPERGKRAGEWLKEPGGTEEVMTGMRFTILLSENFSGALVTVVRGQGLLFEPFRQNMRLEIAQKRKQQRNR
jgi:hypothetical protein